MPCVWLSVDASDSDLCEFLRYFLVETTEDEMRNRVKAWNAVFDESEQ